MVSQPRINKEKQQDAARASLSLLWHFAGFGSWLVTMVTWKVRKDSKSIKNKCPWQHYASLSGSQMWSSQFHWITSTLMAILDKRVFIYMLFGCCPFSWAAAWSNQNLKFKTQMWDTWLLQAKSLFWKWGNWHFKLNQLFKMMFPAGLIKQELIQLVLWTKQENGPSCLYNKHKLLKEQLPRALIPTVTWCHLLLDTGFVSIQNRLLNIVIHNIYCEELNYTALTVMLYGCSTYSASL